ncbi:MAG: sugar ABC transporter ATP-binding protein [Planctomycetota bacterium]|nr:sugar ABC transporter ATP-binding protein [Planctomycetota bacterium]
MASVRFEAIAKRFPGVQALSDVSFEIAAGSCHALCGENGAGKSTLGKILGGIHAPDGGRICLDGKPVHFRDPRDARAAGVAVVHQELAFCENLSVAENLCLGALPARGGFIDRAKMEERAREMLEAIGAGLDVRAPVGRLTVGQQQMVQIAAAMSGQARAIVFDEPTSSLTQHETEKLFELLRRLRAQGVTCIYVSHRMAEIFAICDAVTVLRDGRHVATCSIQGLTEDELVQMMIGRKVEAPRPAHVDAAPGEELLRVENLASPGRFSGVSFALRAGEVLGMAGLVGAGRTEVAQALFGLDPAATGRIVVQGREAAIRSARDAMAAGLGLVPEDRKRHGLVLSMNCRENATLPMLERLARWAFVRGGEERGLVDAYFRTLNVRAPDMDFPAAGLSGGNQQKIALAKWLASRCRILLLDEPTRGVDIGAKAEIHALIGRLACEGHAILLISSEMPELLGLSTRILVLREGRVAGERSRAEATQDGLMRLMAGLRAA